MIAQNKTLLINSNNKIDSIEKVKQELTKTIDPSNFGIGMTIGSQNKNEGLVLKCLDNKDIKEVLSTVQWSLEREYNVVEKPLL